MSTLDNPPTPPDAVATVQRAQTAVRRRAHADERRRGAVLGGVTGDVVVTPEQEPGGMPALGDNEARQVDRGTALQALADGTVLPTDAAAADEDEADKVAPGTVVPDPEAERR